MQITDVRVRKITKEGKMRAIVSITIDDEFVIHDIKVIEGEKGLFIAMPSKKATDGEYRDIAHPINSGTRENIQKIILDSYEKALAEVGDKVDATEKAAVEADIQALKDLLAKANTDELSDAQVAEIKAAKEKLMESAQKLFAKVYEQAQGAQGFQGGPQAGPAPEGYGADDVVDGDYKEV